MKGEKFPLHYILHRYIIYADLFDGYIKAKP